MQQDRNAFNLGLTIVTALVLLCVAVLYIGGKSFEPRDPIVVRVAHDQRVAKLKPGAPVICGPQQVGAVVSIHLVEADSPDNNGDKDFLYFEIHAEVNRALGLRSDCVIAAEGSILGDTGQLRVVHRGSAPDLLTADQPVYARARGFTADWEMISHQFDDDDPTSLIARVKSQLDPDLPESLVAKIHASVSDVNAITAGIKRAVDPTKKATLVGKLDSILTHVNTITAALRDQVEPGNDTNVLAKVHHGLDSADEALKELVDTIAENRGDVRSAVAAVKNATTTLDESILPAVKGEFDRDRAESLLARVHQAFDGIDTSLDDVNTVTDKARRVAALSEDRLVAVVQHAQEASQHLKALSKDLRHRPWRLMHKPDSAETREAQTLDAVREFTEASALLDESTKTLDALLETYGGQIPADDQTLIAIREKLTGALEQFTKAEEALWDRLELQ